MIRNAVTVFAVVLLAACSTAEPDTPGAPPAMRRLTESQYRQSIADVFGDDIVVGGRFDPVNRVDGLLAVGASRSAINASAFERYDALAQSIAAQVVDPAHRDVLIPCRPGKLQAAETRMTATRVDDSASVAASGVADSSTTSTSTTGTNVIHTAAAACARAFFQSTGRLLYRRALTRGELDAFTTYATRAAATLDDFHAGLAASLAALLVRPEFLFVTDTIEPDPARAGASRLTGHAMAARLSFFLWNTTPDALLLAAAEQGELTTEEGIARQVDRLLDSPRLAEGVRAFFTDMLALEAFETLQKDSVIYPAFSLAATGQAREQLLRTVLEQLIDRRGDYRELFTSRRTVMSADLGPVYRVQVGQPRGWEPFEFPSDDARIGIQSFAGFVALYSHPGRSSATLRGKAIREILMCQKVPDPPANVDFTLVSDNHDPRYRTARQRLAAHATDSTCAGCHRVMDPLGLALENFDGAGQYRATENDAPIDTSGMLDGHEFRDPEGLGAALAASPAITSCLVTRAFAYSVGRTPGVAQRPVLQYLEAKFAADGYRVPELFRTIALSKSFAAVRVPDEVRTANSAGPDTTARAARVAANSTCGDRP